MSKLHKEGCVIDDLRFTHTVIIRKPLIPGEQDGLIRSLKIKDFITIHKVGKRPNDILQIGDIVQGALHAVQVIDYKLDYDIKDFYTYV